MHRLPLLALACLLSSCDLVGFGGIRAVVISQVRVEALDLDAAWDNPLTNDRPDVYVDIKDLERDYFGPFQPLWRSEVRDNVAPDDLPLSFSLDAPLRVGVDKEVIVSVADQDGVGDDSMFSTGRFRFQEYADGKEQGAIDRIVFEDGDVRVVVTLRWD